VTSPYREPATPATEADAKQGLWAKTKANWMFILGGFGLCHCPQWVCAFAVPKVETI